MPILSELAGVEKGIRYPFSADRYSVHRLEHGNAGSRQFVRYLFDNKLDPNDDVQLGDAYDMANGQHDVRSVHSVAEATGSGRVPNPVHSVD